MEPIVPRAEIREKAWAAAEQGIPLHLANPYPENTAAHQHFEVDYWAREMAVNAVGVA